MTTMMVQTEIRLLSKVCGLSHRPICVKHAAKTHRSKTLSIHDALSVPIRVHELTTRHIFIVFIPCTVK